MRFLLILVVILFVASVCSAATLRVPSQYAYIQQAVVNADQGDTILVESGTHDPEPHDGDLLINIIGNDKNNLTLISEFGKDSTILNGRVSVELVNNIAIRDFTILNSVTITDSDNSIVSNCVITVDGYGLVFGHCENLSVELCNVMNAGGNGIEIGNCSINLTGSLIHNCLERGLRVFTSTGIVRDCLIYNNEGDGIYQDASMVHYTNNTITYNNQSGFWLHGGNPTLDHNIITFNGYAGVVVDYGVNPLIICNNTCDNSSFANGNYVGYITDQTGYNGNISVDPLFCDPDSDDYSVDADSPVLAQDCGVMGALPDPGCSTQTATVQKSWGAIKSMYR